MLKLTKPRLLHQQPLQKQHLQQQIQYKHLGQVHNKKIQRPTRETLLQLEERTNSSRKPMVVHLSLQYRKWMLRLKLNLK